MNKGELSPDGDRVVASAESGEIRIHDLRTPDPPLGVMKHQGLVYETRFSPDGRWIATAGFDKTARLWDGWTGAAITPPLTNRSLVWHAMFAPGNDAWSYAGFGAFIQPLRSEPRPADTLTLLAELHAGRTVSTAGQEIPLVTGRALRTLAACPFEAAVTRGHARFTGCARAPTMQALTRNWRGVIEALEQARRRGPLPWADAMRLLNAYGGVGSWQAARALIRDLRVPFHAAPELAHVDAIASAHLQGGSRTAELCRILIDESAGTRNPDLAAATVRVCLLASSPEPLPWAALTDLAARAPLVTGDYMRRSGLVGAALVSAGKVDAGFEAAGGGLLAGRFVRESAHAPVCGRRRAPGRPCARRRAVVGGAHESPLRIEPLARAHHAQATRRLGGRRDRGASPLAESLPVR